MTEQIIRFVGWLFAITVYGIGAMLLRAFREAERQYRPETRRWR